MFRALLAQRPICLIHNTTKSPKSIVERLQSHALHLSINSSKSNFHDSPRMAKKSAILLLADGTEEMEAIIVADVLRRAGVDVNIASITDTQNIKCSRDVKVLADSKLSESSKDAKFDVVVLPGGNLGSKAFASSKEVGALLKAQEAGNRLIAAICAAPTALKAHGIGSGKKITCYPSMKDQLTENYSWVNEKVVIDGNLITSQGPATSFAFGLAIAEKLLTKEVAVTVAKGLLYEDYK